MLSGIWRKYMHRGTLFQGAYPKLRWLYLFPDPWNMTSAREQHRFARTSELVASTGPRPARMIELGCGEGHQSVYFAKLTDKLHGIDIGAQAIARARKRCPEAEFSVAELEQVPALFAGKPVDMIVACEVLYYLPDAGKAIEALQELAPRLFVTNYQPCCEPMRHFFTGPGWRRLDDITYEDKLWETFYWERGPAA